MSDSPTCDGPLPADELVMVREHPIDSALREERIPHIWCPGCGLGPATNCYTRAMEIVDIPREQQVVVSGIGCSGRVAG